MYDIFLHLLVVVGVLGFALSAAAGLIWLERRLLGLWQDRYGPNRVGPFGLMQVLADMIKIFTKEDWIPPFADRPVFVIAPTIVAGRTHCSPRCCPTPAAPIGSGSPASQGSVRAPSSRRSDSA